MGFGISTPAPAQPAPALPHVISYDSKAYAWLWDAATATWRLLPRNEARVLYHEQGDNKQLTGTLTIDGNYPVPTVPAGQSVLLLFRKEGNFKRHAGLPANESGFEVTRLDVTAGPRKNQLIRTAQLHRQGESAATFGAKREPITVQKITRPDGIFHAVQLTRALPAGRYALYLPDRAFEFAVK